MATIETPWRSPFWTRLSVISPFLAYIRMLRAISEMAAAMTVCSPLENPATAANARPCCLASTTSTSAAIGSRSSSPTVARLLGFVEPAFFGAAIEEGESFFEVQHGGDALERQAELHHGERHVGLNADDDRLGAAEARHVRDVTQCPYRERVHHVERGDVHDDAATARPPDLGDQGFAKMGEIGVCKGGLNRGNEILPLPQNRYFHGVLLLARRFWSDFADLRRRRRAIGEQALSLFDASLQVTDRGHFAQVDADRHQRLRDFGRQARHDDRGAQQAGRFDRLHQVVGDAGVHGRHTGHVDHDDLGAVGANRAQQLFGELTGTLWIDDADDRQNQQPLAHLKHWRRQLPDRFLLLPDDALALFDESDGHRVRDAVRRGLVAVEDSVQLFDIVLVFIEQRAGEYVTEQEHDADDFVCFDAPRNDSLRQSPRVRLQGFERSGLERFHVVVVYRGRFGEDFFLGHRRQQLGARNAPRPFLAQLRAVLSQVRDQLAQQPGRGFRQRRGFRRPRRDAHAFLGVHGFET